MAKAKTRPARERQPLTREFLLDSSLQEIEVYIESIDRWVWIRELSSAQVQNDSAKVYKNNGDINYSKLVGIKMESALRQVIDGPEGKRLFSEDDIKELQKKSGNVVTEITDKVNEFSGQQKTGDQKSIVDWLESNYPEILSEYQKESPVDAAEENFTTTPNGNSPSN